MARCRRGISMLRVVILMPRQMNSSTTGDESKVTSLTSCTQPNFVHSTVFPAWICASGERRDVGYNVYLLVIVCDIVFC
ncbi:hypothetical protein H5410_062815 [Solanum commersonii]|uniref:Uncharacterized protein n=1 Tax=Solanum commersonii TaxID=4109 RepID=A0A9J5WBN7_SOLCO|nr:hypothetical protein H5410_062815 [Solanum commersonii]